MATYKILAVNDDKDFCQCCGKQGLRRVVWVDRDNTEILHLGTTCAAKKMTNGKKRIDTAIYLQADKMLNEVADACWHIKDRKDFESAMKIELMKRNAQDIFNGLSHKIFEYIK